MTKRIAGWCRRLAAWLDPTPMVVPPDRSMLQRAVGAAVVAAEQTWPDASGEFKRHQVYAGLLKQFPEEAKRTIAFAIEQALQGE